jgi:bacteriorhodopsin
MFLGALMASSFWFVYIKFQGTGKMSVVRWILTSLSILWGAFTLAWIVSSIGEGEMQAAGMGLLIFGAILLVLVIVTVRLNSLIQKKKANKVEAA